ncbi:MAG: segregation/condensation protein A [Myxococcales bacterium]|nr:segregation/condensation protein A [Myxococcales bacterium]
MFEGPLDLLLYLVKRDGVDLMDLEICSIADAYVAYLEQMRALDLSLAADWLVMAATLVHLKSLELLPRKPTMVVEDEVDPRERLRVQLQDYERVKATASALDDRQRLGRDSFSRAAQQVKGNARPVVASVDAFGLLETYFELLARRDRPEPVVELKTSGPDVGACCRRVLSSLGGVGGTRDLRVLLQPLQSPAERVVTFVGVLEMTRLRWLDVVQEVHLGPASVKQLLELEQMDLALVLGEEDPQGSLPLEMKTPKPLPVVDVRSEGAVDGP